MSSLEFDRVLPTRRGLAAGILGAALLAGAPPARAVEFTGHVKAGVEDVTLDRSRLGFDTVGDLQEFRVREGGVQTRLGASITMFSERDVGPWVLDTENRIDYDVFSETQITSERFDRANILSRTTLARELSDSALFGVEASFRSYVEQFLPDLEGTWAALDFFYEKELGGDAYVHGRLGTRTGSLPNNPADDFDEVRLELTYQHLPPERYRTEILPFHQVKREQAAWEFLYGEALRLDRARHLLRTVGDASLLADLATDPPLPPAWRGGLVKPHIGIRDSIFLAGAELISRDLAGGNSFTRAAVHAGVEWTLSDFMAIAVRDTFAAQDWEFTDRTRLRSDRVQNHFSLDVTYSKEFHHVTFQAGLDTHLLDDISTLDYNRPHAGIYGSYDPGGRYRFFGFLRGAQERNIDEQPDFPDLSRWDTLLGMEYRFRPHETLELTLLNERVNITGLQSEFDSAYDDDTFKARYRRRIRPQVWAEAGYVHKDEAHEFFTQNDRTDSSLFANVEVAF